MTKEEIGTNIRQKREQLHISQEAVAYALNISQAAYSKIERNETKVKVEQVYIIADCLDLTIYDLLPPSLASDLTFESIYGLVWYYLKWIFVKLSVMVKA